jgi:hypothetical protein
VGKSCLFPWGWFSKGSLAGMRSKETAFNEFQIFKKSN